MFAAIHGHHEAKELLQELIITPFKQRKHPSPIISILLIGPPGCGKTHLGNALAEELKGVAAYYHLHSSSIVSHSKNLDGQIGYLQDEIKRVVDTRPSLLFLDDVASEDGMFPCALTDRFGGGLTAELIKLKQSGEGNGVALIGATQSPWNMDQHLWKLFDVKIYLKKLVFEDRLAILQQCLQEVNMEADAIEMLAKNTEQYTGADILVLSRDICMIPVKALMNTKHSKAIDEKRAFASCSSTDADAIAVNFDDIVDDQLKLDRITKEDAMETLRQAPRHVDNWQRYKLFEESSTTKALDRPT